MNLLNRIIVILAILLAILIIPITLAWPEQAEFVLRYVADVLQANLEWLHGLSPVAYFGMRLVLGGLGLIALLVGLLSLALEVIHIRRQTVQIRDGGGEVMVEGIPAHLSYHIDMLPDVLRVRPEVISKGNSVQVTLRVDTAPSVRVPEKTAEIQAVTRRVIEEQLGLRLSGDSRVIIQPVPFPKGPAAPAAEPPADTPSDETPPAGTPPSSAQPAQIIEVKNASSS